MKNYEMLRKTGLEEFDEMMEVVRKFSPPEPIRPLVLKEGPYKPHRRGYYPRPLELKDFLKI